MSSIEPRTLRVATHLATIRAAEEADAKALLAFRLMSAGETDFLSREVDEFPNTTDEEAAFIGRKVSSSVDLFIVAEIGQRIVAIASLDGSPQRRSRHSARLGLAVLREFWGRGLGRALVELLLAWADAHGVVRVALEVVETNARAIAFYEALGFEYEGRLRYARKHGASYFDNHLMSRICGAHEPSPVARCSELSSDHLGGQPARRGATPRRGRWSTQGKRAMAQRMAAHVLSHEEAKTFYDRFGSKQDLQRIYEDPAIEVLLRHGAFERARAVVEFGCGTGRFAARLLEQPLPAAASYVGFDISRTMVQLAQRRVADWAGRAQVQLTDGSPSLPLASASCDRFLSTYVLDLLSEQEIGALLREARRVVAPGGRLCLASLTFGQTAPSRLVARLWSGLHALSPKLVGGCRPLHLAALVAPQWRVLQREVVCSFGICTEVVVAE